MRQESFLQSIGSAVMWKGLDRVTGLTKHVLIAASIGLSAQLDVFYMAIALLGVLVFSWGNMLDVVAVPSMVSAVKGNRTKELKQVASGLFLLSVAGSVLLVILLVMTREHIAAFAIGFEAERREMLAEAVPWLAPVILLYVPFRFMGAVLRAQRRFSCFYQAEFLTASIVLVCVFLFKEHEQVLLWSFSLGVTGAFVLLLAQTRSQIFPFANPFSSAVRMSLRLAPGLLLLQGAHYVYVLTDRVFVSFLGEGSVSALAYAMTIIGLAPSLIWLSGSFITIIAEMPERNAKEKRLNDLISMTLYISMGVSCLTLIAGESMVQLLLERGVFTEENTMAVTQGVVAFSWMVFPLFLIGPLDQFFQVENRIGLIVRRTILGIVTNAVLNALFLFALGWGLFGVALATSISYWIMLVSGIRGLQTLGYSVHTARHVKWTLWNVLFLLTAYVLFDAIDLLQMSSAYRLVASLCTVTACMALAGALYGGEERRFLLGVLDRVSRSSSRSTPG